MNKELLESAERAYREGKPFLTDADFDRLSGKDSGESVFFSGDLIAHKRPLLSLRHTYDLADVIKWSRWLKYQLGHTPELILEPKIDGLALSIIYDESGHFRSAATKHRGAGEGFDVTEKIRKADCVPERGPAGQQITGEFVLTKGYLLDDTYKTERSLACAYLQSKSDDLADMGFRFYPHGLGGSGGYLQRKEELCELYGFNELDYRTADASDLESVFHRFVKMREFWSFEADGIVFRVNDLGDFYKLGDNSRYPLGAIAYKWKGIDM